MVESQEESPRHTYRLSARLQCRRSCPPCAPHACAYADAEATTPPVALSSSTRIRRLLRHRSCPPCAPHPCAYADAEATTPPVALSSCTRIRRVVPAVRSSRVRIRRRGGYYATGRAVLVLLTPAQAPTRTLLRHRACSLCAPRRRCAWAGAEPTTALPAPAFTHARALAGDARPTVEHPPYSKLAKYCCAISSLPPYRLVPHARQYGCSGVPRVESRPAKGFTH